jgi:hypothetical protein
MTFTKNTNFEKLLIAIAVLLLLSSDRNLLITQLLIGGRSNIQYVTVVSIISVVFSAVFFTIIKGYFNVSKIYLKLLLIGLLLASYFFIHELMFNDGLISAKYTVFLFIIMLSFMVRYNFFFVFKFLGYAGGIICIFIASQQILLLGLKSGDISGFDIFIRGHLWGRWVGCDFIIPYGLGLIESCPHVRPVTLFGLEINRSLFFSTEPKYISSVLLITFSSLLISKKNSFAKSLFFGLHLLAFIFVGSASAILILLFSVIIFYVKYIGPKIFTLIVFILPVFLLPVLFYFLFQFLSFDGFILTRIMSASGSVGEGGLNGYSLFGETAKACTDQECKNLRKLRGLLSSLAGTYGYFGLGIFSVFFYLLIKPTFTSIRNEISNPSESCGLIILINTYVVFNIYFFGDIFNMFGLFIILTIIFLPNHINNKHYSFNTKKLHPGDNF